MVPPDSALHATINERSLQQLVDRFYARVRADDVIGSLFNDAVADWSEHLD